MNGERDRRHFEAGLSEEVDAWLRGDTSRREFLGRLAWLGGGLAAGPGLVASLAAEAAVDLADPSTPLGQAQAAAMKASTEGPANNSAFRAVQAAKKYKGATLSTTYESGLQALEPRNFSGPVWQELTAIGPNTLRVAQPELNQQT